MTVKSVPALDYEKVPLLMQIQSAKYLMPFIHPKLVSKRVDKIVKRVSYANMNHLTNQQREEVVQLVDDARENGELDS